MPRTLAILFIFLSDAAAAQTATLTGIVRNETGQPLEAVSVRFTNQPRGAVTDRNGRYTMLSVAPGIRIVTAQRIGYAQGLDSVSIPAAGTVTLDITLREQPSVLSTTVGTGVDSPRVKRPFIVATLTQEDMPVVMAPRGGHTRIHVPPVIVPVVSHARFPRYTAEAAAASIPRLPPPRQPGDLFAEGDALGTRDRKCVDVALVGPINRSGEFVTNVERAITPNRAASMVWFPLHTPQTETPRVELRAVSLDGSSSEARIANVRTAVALTPARQAIFTANVTFPESGKWMMIASSGPNWGCVVVSVR